MSTEVNPQIAMLRKPLYRQCAVSEDFADGPVTATRASKRVPQRQSIYLNRTNDSSTKNLKTQKNKSDFQTPQGIHPDCKTPSQQNTLLKELLARYNKELSLFKQNLLNRRNSETIHYDSATPCKETTHPNQHFRKPPTRRDISDGLPVSSEAEEFASAQQKGSANVLSGQAALHQAYQSTESLTSKKDENSPRKYDRSLDSSSLDDEGFENGSFRKHSTSRRESLTDIKKTYFDVPKIELNGTESISISESGREKGEGFRQSKKSSGYGTGGSEENELVHDGDCFSSVFEDSLNQLIHSEAPHSSTGKRTVDIQCSSFKPDICAQLCRSIKIPQSIKNKLEDWDNMSHDPDYDDLIMKLIEANPQVPFSVDHMEGNRRLNEVMDDIEKAYFSSISELSSQSWAEYTSKDTPQSYLDNEELELQFSNLTVSEIDGESFATGHNSDVIKGTQFQQPMVNGHSDVSMSANGYTAPIWSHSASGCASPSSQANGYVCSSEWHTTSGCEVGEVAPVNDRCRAGVKTWSLSQHLDSHGIPRPGLRGNGITSKDVQSEAIDADRNTAQAVGMAKQVTSRQPVWKLGNSSQEHRSPIGANGYTHQANYHDETSLCNHLASAIFCNNQSCTEDFKCCQGKRQILQLQNCFQMDELKQAKNILKCLWIHSKDCLEVECAVPFCNVFSQRPFVSFEEHFAFMSSNSMNKRLQMDLVNVMESQVQSGTLLQLSPSDPISFATWTTARMLKGQFLGQFGDFNILRGQLALHDSSPLEVVIKKVNSYKNAKNVYFQLGKDPLSYIARNFWCSEISDNVLLVCSVYYRDWNSLHHESSRLRLTSDLCLILTLTRQVVLAAQHLHSLKPSIVYLSWKCSSVLYDGGTNIKLCNFSRAMQLQPGKINKCPTSIRNTVDPRFTAPEVLCDEPVGFYSDIWGIGCLFYEFVTKSPPYPDHPHTPPAIIREMVRRNQIDHTFPSDTEFLAILHPCWERSACDRWTLQSLLGKLEELLETGRALER